MWWIVHVLDAITLGVAIVYVALALAGPVIPANKVKKLRAVTSLSRRIAHPLLSPIMEAPGLEELLFSNGKADFAREEKTTVEKDSKRDGLDNAPANGSNGSLEPKTL